MLNYVLLLLDSDFSQNECINFCALGPIYGMRLFKYCNSLNQAELVVVFLSVSIQYTSKIWT